ncbi:MAG: T9SS type A sorting domain-containing protein [Flavobacteriales bacterium]|nr:T9SS type A sorting domain-containing protein [Flavobacteriales bacterium]
MKKIYTILFVFIAFSVNSVFATSYTINISGLTYTPATLNAVVGDEITIQATGNHPLVQVSQTTWDADGTTQLSGGFGPETSDYTFTITSTDDIYYVCMNHVSLGMKGKIIVSAATGIVDAARGVSLQVFPNPVVKGDFMVRGNGQTLDNTKLEIYNISGQLVRSLNLKGEEAKLHATLADGVYSVIISKDDKAILRERLVFLSE